MSVVKHIEKLAKKKNYSEYLESVYRLAKKYGKQVSQIPDKGQYLCRTFDFSNTSSFMDVYCTSSELFYILHSDETPGQKEKDSEYKTTTDYMNSLVEEAVFFELSRRVYLNGFSWESPEKDMLKYIRHVTAPLHTDEAFIENVKNKAFCILDNIATNIEHKRYWYERFRKLSQDKWMNYPV